MGISITNYFLNIRPVILKQKTIILGALGLLFLNVWLHLFEFYNVVICLFAATGVLIILSIIQIYAVFKGKGFVLNEIREYILYILNSKKKYEIKREVLNGFVKEWKEYCLEQSQVEYKNYYGIFKHGINILLSYKQDYAVKDVNEVSVIMSRCLLNADKDKVVERGIDFVQSIYEEMFFFTKDGNIRNCNFKEKFDVFGEILRDFEKAMETLPILTVEHTLRWGDLADDIGRVSFLMHCNSDDEEMPSELYSIYQFSRDIGYFLRKQRINNGIEKINSRYWGDFLRTLQFEELQDLSEKNKEKYLEYKYILYFEYCYGLIHSGFLSIVKESIFYDLMPNILYSKYKKYIKFFLLLECYLYYLSREEESCVSKQLKDDVNQLLTEKEVVDRTSSLVSYISGEPQILSPNIKKELTNILFGYEQFPKYSNSKSMIMEGIVEDFFVCLVLYIKNIYYIPTIFGTSFGYDEIEIIFYQKHFLGDNEQRTKNELKRFYSLVDIFGKDENHINSEIDVMYQVFNNYIIKVYKYILIHKATIRQEKYETAFKQEELITEIEQKVKTHLNDIFGPIINKNYNSEIPTYKVLLLKKREFSDTLTIKSISGYYSDIDACFLTKICDVLEENKAVFMKKRIEFQNDDMYISYLKKIEAKTLLGPGYVFKNKDYKKKQLFDDYVKECDCIFTGYSRKGLALKKNSLEVYIQSVEAEICPLTLDEVDSLYNDETGRYAYEIKRGVVVEFEKEELKNFLHDERKILTIYVNVSITHIDNVGIIIQRQ